MRQWIAIGAAVGLVAVCLPYLRSHDAQIGDMLAKGKARATAAIIKREVTPPPLTDLDLSRIDARGGVATAPAHGERKAELTLVPKYQRAAEGFLRNGHVPEGAVVMTDVKTGKVLVWASIVEDGPMRDIAAEATAPSASVFKIITATTLVEQGFGPSTKQCYSGGEHQLKAIDLVDDKKRDKWCATMTQAMGRSLNTVFARLASKNLDRDKISGVAARYGYNSEIPFDVKIAPSTLKFPDDDLGFARTAAGFWNSTLSPFEGANLATTIANGGDMIRLFVVNSVKDESGELYHGPTGRQVVRHVLDETVAAQVTTMMENTVESGTSYKSFHDKSGKAYLPDIRVAGKTGTLTKPAQDGPFYTWFVGFAPSRKPEVAISVMVANHLKWRVKATNVASDMLRVYFADKGAPGVRAPGDHDATAQR
ncbi:Cell division protein FtsI [Minicystis rosea]|nr:Cell division protein FtsI [Minicystis rosea]